MEHEQKIQFFHIDEILELFVIRSVLTYIVQEMACVLGILLTTKKINIVP